MNLEYQHLLPEDFAAGSRVWVYQSPRMFTLSEVLQVEDILNNFIGSWNTHGTPVKGFATVFFGQFIMLMADESDAQVSGCSTDSSVHVIKQIEREFNVNLFDRQSLAFVRNNKVELLPLSQFSYASEHGFIKPETLYFNNLVQTKAELIHSWIIPVDKSWLAGRLAKMTI